MEIATLVGKHEKRKAITELIAHPGFAILRAEIARKVQEATAAACNIKLTSTERDAGAGAKTALEELDAYPETLLRALDIVLKEKRTLRRSQRIHG